MEPYPLNPDRSEAFAERLLDAIRNLAPSTSEGIAEAANLNERYVHEWLGAMLAGGIVECDGHASRFSLPPEYAAWLTGKAGRSDMAFPSSMWHADGGGR
jgi:DNA-binding IclR family transcriptional regulator